jgi:hypothetical protein
VEYRPDNTGVKEVRLKTEIVVTLEGITKRELQEAVQGLLDLEQHDPERITMSMTVTAHEMTKEEITNIWGTYFSQIPPRSPPIASPREEAFMEVKEKKEIQKELPKLFEKLLAVYKDTPETR